MTLERDGNTARVLPYPEPEFPDKDSEGSPSPPLSNRIITRG
jgi:hypothetical protein